jgi:hypothetical protein
MNKFCRVLRSGFVGGLVALSTGCAAEQVDEGNSAPEKPGSAASSLHVYPSPSVALHLQVLPSNTSLPGYGSIGTETDPYRPDDPHAVYRPAIPMICVGPCPPRKLVLFLHGAGASPQGYLDFMERQWKRGFHVIGLGYPAPQKLVTVCDTPNKTVAQKKACYGKVRQEIAFGDDTYTLANAGVDPPITLGESHPQDAISKRFKALILHLESVDPYGGWGGFLVSDPSWSDGLRPVWSRIVVAGHSAGAGYASYIAHQISDVSRIAMLAGGGDAVDFPSAVHPTPANWVPGGSSPASRYFGLLDTEDCTDNRNHRIPATWTAIGMTPSPPTLVNSGSYAGSKQLEYDPGTGTCNSCGVGCNPHNHVAKDKVLFGGVWDYMVGSPP